MVICPLAKRPRLCFTTCSVELPPAEGSSALIDNSEASGAEAPSLIGQSLPCRVLVSLWKQQEKGRARSHPASFCN